MNKNTKTTYSLTMSNPSEVYQNTISDKDNPTLQFTTMDCDMLSQFAKGELNAQEWIQAEMINRGQGPNGWAGFDKAKDEWNEFNWKNRTKIAKH